MPKVGRRSVLCVVLVVALVVSSPVTARAAEITTHKPGFLQVCLYAGFAPFVYKEGTDWKGWDVDYLKRFLDYLNNGKPVANQLQWEVVEQPIFDDIWRKPGEDLCDIAGTGISDTADRRKATSTSDQVGCWSDTYYGVLRTFLVRTQEYARLQDVHDLAGKTAIVTKGSTANTDLCYRMRLASLYPCEKEDLDHPCDFKGLQGFRETTRGEDGSCVDIEYPPGNDEKNAATAILADTPSPPFTYGGGYGSIRILVDTTDQRLALVWPHCNMGSDFQAYSEPFSFVVRAKSTGLLAALNEYIAKTQPPLKGSFVAYAGTPIPDLGCETPPWTNAGQPDVCGKE